MKQIAGLLIALVFTSLAFGQSSSLQEGNKCFATGDYSCAIEKYKEAIKSSDEKQQKIAGDNLRQAEKCFELIKMADAAFADKNFIEAREYYQSLLNENPKDEHAKAQLKEIKIELITLSVSKKAVVFSSSGGQEAISVVTQAESYTVGLLPSWCSVQKNEKHFVITCSENTSTAERTDIFTVSAGNKTEKINIRQSGKQEITLNVSKENISFTSATGNSGPISVYTNAAKFSISSVPSWCTVQTYNNYFTVTCNSNTSTQSRSSWFNVVAGNKEIKINVNQAGQISSTETSEAKVENVGKTPVRRIEKSTKAKSPLTSFTSLGFQSGEIAKYGLLFELGGKTIGFRLAARSSLTPEQDVLNTIGLPNRTEVEIGPNIKIFKWCYLNLSAGYGYYNTSILNEYAGTRNIGQVYYVVTSGGLMIRLNRIININGGASFMDIHKDFYKPEITGGISFNLRKNRY
jgi:hypothetical protein